MRSAQAGLQPLRVTSPPGTGLDVDITVGASPSPQAIDLPAGRFGRPVLAPQEPWVRRGVAATILSAIDRKSVVLFGLILVVCGLFVANAASAAVRSRRTELGVLACLGWPASRLFAVVLAELGAVGLAAGLLGGLPALPIAAPAGVDASVGRAALAVPAAVLLALLAATVAFHDTLVGTLLGDAVAVQVRATDYVAVGAIVLLGAGAVADVLFLTCATARGELATLLGAGLGLAGVAQFTHALPVDLLATTAFATAAGTALAGLAALAPAVWLRRQAPGPAARRGVGDR